MLFPSTELVARIERAEAGLIVDSVEAVRKRRPNQATFVREIGGGTATFAGNGSPLNKVVGLGFSDAPSDEEFDRLEQAYAEHATPVQIELAQHAEGGCAPRLCRRGYVVMGFEDVLGMRPAIGETPIAEGIEIARSRDGRLAEWVETIVDGFLVPDVQGVASHESFPRELLLEVISDMAAAESFVAFEARIEGRIVGGGAMTIHDGVTHLCGASTLPAHRRRGVQSSLLAHRLRCAQESGSDLVVMTTQPGSKSQENAMRRGFSRLYTRTIFVLEPRSASK